MDSDVEMTNAGQLERELGFYFNTEHTITQKQKEMVSHLTDIIVKTGYTFNDLIKMECGWFLPLHHEHTKLECADYVKQKTSTHIPFPFSTGQIQLTPNLVFNCTQKDTMIQETMGAWLKDLIKAMLKLKDPLHKLNQFLLYSGTDDIDYVARSDSGSHYIYNEDSKKAIASANGNFDLSKQHEILLHHLKRYTRFQAHSTIDQLLTTFEQATGEFLTTLSSSFNRILSLGTINGPKWITSPFVYDRPLTLEIDVPIAVTIQQPSGQVSVFDSLGNVLRQVCIVGASVAYADTLIYPDGTKCQRLLVGTYFGTVYVFLNDTVHVLYYKHSITGIRSQANSATLDPTCTDTRLAVWTKSNMVLIDPRPNKIAELFFHQLPEGAGMTILDVSFLGSVLCAVFDTRSMLTDKQVPSPNVDTSKNRSEKQFRMFDLLPMEYNSYYTFGIYETQSRVPTHIARSLKQERMGAIHTLPECFVINDAEMLVRLTFGFFKKTLHHMAYICNTLTTGAVTFQFNEHTICYTLK